MTSFLTRFLIAAAFFMTVPVYAADAPAEEPAAEKVVEKKAEEPKAEEKAEEKKEEPKEDAKKDEAPAEPELTPEQKKAADAIVKDAENAQKAAEDVFALTEKISKDLGPEEKKHFFLIYNNYSLLGTVKMVQTDISNAVKACGEVNPEMKAGIDAEFAEWNTAVDPVIKEADANINNMVIAQDYAKPAQIKKVFDGLDKVRKLTNKQIDKQPVTTADACEYLQDKMDDTRKNFVRLLQSTLVSAPQAITVSTEPEEPKAEEKAEEKKEEPKSEDKPAEEPVAQ